MNRTVRRRKDQSRMFDEGPTCLSDLDALNSRRVVSLKEDLLATLRCCDRLDIDRPIMNFGEILVLSNS
jgi:hypothetical protein